MTRAMVSSWRLGAVAAVLLTQTACLEDFVQLVTTVRYDPVAGVYHVERVLTGLEASFFQCDTVDTCHAAVARTLALEPSSSMDASLADRLVARLLDTGAEDLRIRLERREDRVDARVTYTAPVGSKAAADTMVHAEWGGKRGKERYYLVLEAQDSISPPDVPYDIRRQSVGTAGTGWREYWVLSPKVLEVTTAMAVDADAAPLLASVPGLAEALERDGLLGAPTTPPIAAVVAAAPAPEPAVAAVDEPEEEPALPAPPVATPAPVPAAAVPAPAPGPAPEPEPEPAPAPEPVAAAEPVAAPEPEPEPPPPPVAKNVRAWPAPDPSSPAKTYVHPLKVEGGLAADVAQRSVAPIVPRVEVCYQRRAAEVPTLAGYAFLNARVRGDGWLVGTSVYGELPDLQLIRCLEEAIEGWTFAPWGDPAAIADVDVPLTFRVEVPVESGKRRRRGD